MRGAVVVLVLAASAGCSVVRDDARALVGRGQAEAALRRLEADEASDERAAPDERARRWLWRGLAHLALGDRGRARGWLVRARVLSDEGPGRLDAAEQARLLDALRSAGAEP